MAVAPPQQWNNQTRPQTLPNISGRHSHSAGEPRYRRRAETHKVSVAHLGLHKKLMQSQTWNLLTRPLKAFSAFFVTWCHLKQDSCVELSPGFKLGLCTWLTVCEHGYIAPFHCVSASSSVESGDGTISPLQGNRQQIRSAKQRV